MNYPYFYFEAFVFEWSISHQAKTYLHSLSFIQLMPGIKSPVLFL